MTVDQPTIFVVDEISLAEPHAEMLRVRNGALCRGSPLDLPPC